MRRLAIALLLGLTAAALILLFLPSPIDPARYSPPARPELTGPLAPNTLLQGAELLGEGELLGPEDVDVDRQGRIYCGLEDGSVQRLEPRAAAARLEIFAKTSGRPLGLDFDDEGILWVADGQLGLLSIDSRGEVRVRATEAGGVPIGFADDVDVAAGGRVYFSDASTRFGPDDLLLEVLEARPHGRLLEYDPATNRTRVLVDSLYFANGVAVSPDDDYILVAETFRYRIRRYWLSGAEAGRSEVLIDNLPGFPDGVSRSGRGTFWVALYALRSDLLDLQLHPRPWLKGLIARLPRWLLARSDPYGLVLELDAQGRIRRSLHDPGGQRFAFVTSVEEHQGALYLGSVEGTAIGRHRFP